MAVGDTLTWIKSNCGFGHPVAATLQYPRSDTIKSPQYSHGVGVFSRYNADAQVLRDRTMYIMISASLVVLAAVIARSRFIGRQAPCSAIKIADHVQKLSGRSSAS